MLPPLHSIGKSIRPPSILPPARTVIEDEMRRNTFWLAYATERLQGLGHGWVHCLDDQDVTQLLPLRGDQFVDGTLVLPSDRQWAHSKDLILCHPPGQIDSFILYVKGTIMISKVKSFNMRFRAKHFSGDPSVAAPDNEHAESSDYADPRGSPAWVELDEMVSRFRACFPSQLRNPISDGVVDSHLYSACLMPHCASIVLHDPHAEVKHRGCLSALKILTSARSVLDLIYTVWSTSYDISLLDPFCYFCWFVAGRVLVRFLKAAQEAQSSDQVSTLQGELDFVHGAIAKAGERIPMAYRFARMLHDLIIAHCGPQSAPTANPAYPGPLPELLAGPRTNLVQLFETSVVNKNIVQDNLYDPSSFLSMLQ
ncbi:hypothetical protein HGRIS_007801 [Hohenbuehelia grisea]|uniref:Transcription factor domain-containing protein n=1 Tax=Hohenbuehelia grisea TaxID=104357 RepID=A0ABR3J6D2_9AGAR